MMKHIKLKHESLVALANSYSRDNNKAGMEYADSVVDKARKSAFKVMSDPKLREAAEALGQFDKVKEDAFKHERVMKQGGKRISYEEAYKKALKFVNSKEFDRLAKEQGFKFGQSDTQESETPQTQKRGRTR
jgi:hypothetical protein